MMGMAGRKCIAIVVKPTPAISLEVRGLRRPCLNAAAQKLGPQKLKRGATKCQPNDVADEVGAWAPCTPQALSRRDSDVVRRASGDRNAVTGRLAFVRGGVGV